MHWITNLAIGSRLSLLSAALSTALVLLVVSLATATSPKDSLINQGGDIIADQLAYGATEYILGQDNLALQALLSELSKQSLVAYASIADASDKLLAQSGSAQLAGKRSRQFTSPIELNDSVVGYANIVLAGAAAPAMPASRILLLAALVFALVFVFVRFQLQRLDHTLLSLAQRFKLDIHHASAADLDQLCETLQQLAPPPVPIPALKPAVLALRLPGLAQDALSPAELAVIDANLVQLAHAADATIRECADGYLVLLSCGNHTGRRALECARSLQQTLPANIAYGMAIAVDAEKQKDTRAILQKFHWQRLCDNTYQLAAQENTLLLSRSALSEHDIHQRVSVAQGDGDHYRVTGFRDPVQPETASPGKTTQTSGGLLTTS